MISSVNADTQKQDTSLDTNCNLLVIPQANGDATLKTNLVVIPRIVVFTAPVRVVKSSKMKGFSSQVDEVVAKVVQKLKTLSI